VVVQALAAHTLPAATGIGAVAVLRIFLLSAFHEPKGNGA